MIIGQSDCAATQQFIDQQVLTGNNFYRLKIADAYGNFYYSNVILVAKNQPAITIQHVTMQSQALQVWLTAKQAKQVECKVMAVNGACVGTLSTNLMAGSHSIQIPLQQLSAGLYTLVIYGNNGILARQKFLR